MLEVETLPNALEPVGYLTSHRRVRHPNIRALKQYAMLVTEALEVLATADIELTTRRARADGQDPEQIAELADRVAQEGHEQDLQYLEGLRYAHGVLESRAVDVFLTDVARYLPSMQPRLESALASALVAVRELRALFSELTGEPDAADLGILVVPPGCDMPPGPSISVEDLF